MNDDDFKKLTFKGKPLYEILLRVDAFSALGFSNIDAGLKVAPDLFQGRQRFAVSDSIIENGVHTLIQYDNNGGEISREVKPIGRGFFQSINHDLSSENTKAQVNSAEFKENLSKSLEKGFQVTKLSVVKD